jgi:hypothetical protein
MGGIALGALLGGAMWAGAGAQIWAWARGWGVTETILWIITGLIC